MLNKIDVRTCDLELLRGRELWDGLSQKGQVDVLMRLEEAGVNRKAQAKRLGLGASTPSATISCYRKKFGGQVVKSKRTQPSASWRQLSEDEKYTRVHEMEAKGLSLKAKADVLGVSTTTIQRYSDKAASPLTREGKRIRKVAQSEEDQSQDYLNRAISFVARNPGWGIVAGGSGYTEDGALLVTQLVLRKLRVA